MASSVSANGQTTSVPGVIATPKFATAGRSLPQAKVLTVVGEFEQFENGVPAEFTSASALMAAAPGDDFLEQIAGIAFQPGADPLVGAPASVIVASTLPSVAATSPLVDAYDDLAVTLDSKIFGLHGNLLSFTMANNGSDSLKRDIVVYKQGETETLTGLGSGPVLEVGYEGTYATAITLASTGPMYDTQLGDVTGEVHVVLHKTLDPAVDTTLTSTVGSADNTAASKITFDPTTAVGIGAALTSVAIANTGDLFTKASHGLNIGDRVKLSAIAGAPAPSLTPAWSADTVYVVRTNLFTANDFTLALDADGIGGGAVTSDGDGTCTVTYQVPSLTIVGANDSGVATTEVLPLVAGALTDIQTTNTWSRVDTISLSKSGYAGVLYASWTVKKVTRQSAQTLKTLAAVLGDLPNVTCAIKNPRAATMTLGDLDTLPSTDFVNTVTPAYLRCDTSEFARLVNSRSRFITAERELPTSAPTWTRLASTATGAGAVLGTPDVTLSAGGGTGVVTGDVLLFGTDTTRPVFIGVVGVIVTDAVTLTEDIPTLFSDLPVYKLSVIPPKRPASFTGSRRFAGGATGTTSAGTRDIMYEALKLTQTAVLVCMSNGAADKLAAYNYAVTMAGVGAREIQAFSGMDSDSTITNIEDEAITYNSRHMAIATEDIRVIDTTGARRWLDPRFQALQVAAMQCGLGIADPVTNKRPRVVDTRSNAAWNGTSNANDVIQAGGIAYRRDSLGFLVTRGITTYRASDDVNQTELSANESTNWQIRDMRDELAQVIGKNSAAFYPEAIVGLVIQRGRKQEDGKLITKFYPDSVYLTRNGDTVIVGYDFEPAVPNNFVVMVPSVRPVSFSFTLAA